MTTAASIALHLIAVFFAAGCGASLEEKKAKKPGEVLPGIVMTLIIFLIAAALQVAA